MPEQLTIEQLYRETASRLRSVLGDGEGKAAARIIFEDIRGMSPSDIILYGHRSVEDFTAEHIRNITEKIIQGTPVQYAIGKARFCGIDFEVTPAVLIPRPETEGLVDRITADYNGCSDLNILDCGTGSGCIAISLSRALPFASVEAIDISDDALAVARKNASALNVKVKFTHADILALTPVSTPVFDIIVSNPPYIAKSEEKDMDGRVKNFEPSQALFVEDSNPLEFYKPIAVYGMSSLVDNGRLYFEINPRFAGEMRSMLEQTGYTDVDIVRDYLGRYRYAIAKRPAR